ncbi:MAG: hypothetical protein ACR2MO_06990 [Acidimicrobiales bacterium]
MARPVRPPAWAVLEQALANKRPVQARYHGTERVLCPHALGWKHGRPKVLSYQSGGATSRGALTQGPHAWRSMFIDEIEELSIADGPWQTARNFSHDSNCFDDLEIALDI